NAEGDHSCHSQAAGRRHNAHAGDPAQSLRQPVPEEPDPRVDALGPELLVELECSVEAGEAGFIQGPRVVQAARAQGEVVPVAGRNGRPQPCAPLFADVEQPRALRREEPLVRGGGVEVRIDATQAEQHEAGRVGAVDHRDDATLPALAHQLFDGHDRAVGEQNVRDREHAGARRQSGQNAPGRLLRVGGGNGERDDAETDATSRGEELPATQAADVLVVRRDDLVACAELEPLRDPVHPLGGVAREHEPFRVGVEQAAQPIPDPIPGDAGRVRFGDASDRGDHGVHHRPGLWPEGADVEVDAVRRDQEPVPHPAPERLALLPRGAGRDRRLRGDGASTHEVRQRRCRRRTDDIAEEPASGRPSRRLRWVVARRVHVASMRLGPSGAQPWPRSFGRAEVEGMARTLGFLLQYLRPRPGAVEEAEVPYRRDGETLPATLYRPAGRRGPHPAWVVLHGLTYRGRYHPSLERLARALAASGALVFVPEIPEWRRLRVAPALTTATIRSA